MTGFPEFEQFCTFGFPEGTQSLKSLASTNFATPAWVGNLMGKALIANEKAQPRGIRGFSAFLRRLRAFFALSARRDAGAIRDFRTLITEASTMFLMCEA